MPFDPNYPQDGQLIDATDFRNQFNALKALIDNVLATLNAQIASLQGQINALIPDTPHNCASVGDLSLSLSNPTQSFEVQQLIDKINELMGVLRR